MTMHTLSLRFGLMLLATVLLTVSSCSWWENRSDEPPPNPVGEQAAPSPSTPPQPPSASPPPSAAKPAPSPPPPTAPPSTVQAMAPLFYDFPDIPVPQELSLQSDESYVFQTEQFKAGVLTLRGRVELSSLINFFQMALPREGWKGRGGFRYRRSVLIFEKPDRTCVIHLYEKMYYTYAEIYVAPAGSKI